MSVLKLEHPPMGWNSFNCYGCVVHEEDVKANIDFMAENLKQYGYEYIVVDNGWFSVHNLPKGQKYPLPSQNNRHAPRITLDAFGRVHPSEEFFAHGIEEMAAYAHSKGLKFGVHLMRGVPRAAADQKLPIAGTGYTCDQIADRNAVCSWCDYNYGVDMTKPGAQEYYDSLIAKMAAWKLDIIKYDDITAYPQEIEAVVRAMDKVDYPMILSLSPGGDSCLAYMDTYHKATMLRTTPDVWDNQISLDRCFQSMERYAPYTADHFFLDLDMLCIGHLRLNVSREQAEQVLRENEALQGNGVERMCSLTPAQQITFMTMRAVTGSPLMIGSDLPTMGEQACSLVTNREMIRCNQNTRKFAPVALDGFTGWRSDAGYIAVFNREEEDKTFSLSCLERASFRDVWTGRTYDSRDRVTIPAGGALFLAV